MTLASEYRLSILSARSKLLLISDFQGVRKYLSGVIERPSYPKVGNYSQGRFRRMAVKANVFVAQTTHIHFSRIPGPDHNYIFFSWIAEAEIFQLERFFSNMSQ